MLHPNEQFECQNCYFIVELNVHGRCERCDSNAVISKSILPYILEKNYQALFGEPRLA